MATQEIEVPVIYESDIEGPEYPRWITVFLHDRVYGGPEEGGWYYEAGDVQTRVEVQSAEEQAVILKIFNRNYSNEGRPSVSSVLSQGQYEIRISKAMIENYPEVIPHYE